MWVLISVRDLRWADALSCLSVWSPLAPCPRFSESIAPPQTKSFSGDGLVGVALAQVTKPRPRSPPPLLCHVTSIKHILPSRAYVSPARMSLYHVANVGGGCGMSDTADLKVLRPS